LHSPMMPEPQEKSPLQPCAMHAPHNNTPACVQVIKSGGTIYSGGVDSGATTSEPMEKKNTFFAHLDKHRVAVHTSEGGPEHAFGVR
jgi:hypothetical protein